MTDSAESKARGGMMPLILAVVVLTLVGGGGGAALGFLTMPAASDAASPDEGGEADPATGEGGTGAEPHSGGHGAEAEDEGDDEPARTAGLTLVPLDSVYTNLYAPEDVWVRLEASLLVEPEDADGEEVDSTLLAAQVEADTLAFLRSAQLSQLAGSRGLMHLADDLRTRARMRSSAVRDYLIRVLVTE